LFYPLVLYFFYYKKAHRHTHRWDNIVSNMLLNIAWI
jgi:hypothetical protein